MILSKFSQDTVKKMSIPTINQGFELLANFGVMIALILISAAHLTAEFPR